MEYYYPMVKELVHCHIERKMIHYLIDRKKVGNLVVKLMVNNLILTLYSIDTHFEASTTDSF